MAETEKHIPFSGFKDESLADAIEGLVELGYYGIDPIVEEANRRVASIKFPRRPSPELLQAVETGRQYQRMIASKKKAGRIYG